MSLIAPIGPARVAGIRPAPPAPGDDPSEDGLGIELVTEATPVATSPVDTVAAAATSDDAQLDLGRRSFEASASMAVAPLSSADPARVASTQPGGNAAVPTAFDSRPATSLGDAPRGDFASPFARAMVANSVG